MRLWACARGNCARKTGINRAERRVRKARAADYCGESVKHNRFVDERFRQNPTEFVPSRILRRATKVLACTNRSYRACGEVRPFVGVPTDAKRCCRNKHLLIFFGESAPRASADSAEIYFTHTLRDFVVISGFLRRRLRRFFYIPFSDFRYY